MNISCRIYWYETIFNAGAVARAVHQSVASKDFDTCYAAKLLGMQGERFAKPKKVFCFISPKQLTIKEYLLKFIPKRLVTFRLCPSTKVFFKFKKTIEFINHSVEIFNFKINFPLLFH